MGLYHPTNNEADNVIGKPTQRQYIVTTNHQETTNGCRDDHSGLLYRPRPDIIFISASDTELETLTAAQSQLPPGFPRLQAQSSGTLQTPTDVAAFAKEIAPTAQLVIVRILGGLAYFREGLTQLRILCDQTGAALVALPGDNRPDAELAGYTTVDPEIAAIFLTYCVAGGAANYAQGLRYLADGILGTSFGFAPPVAVPMYGLYHPDAADHEATARLDVATFARTYWREAVGPVVGLLFYRAYWQSQDLAVVDALVRALEARGCRPLPVFCYSLRDTPPETLLAYLGHQARADVIISLLSYALADIVHGQRLTRAAGPGLDVLAQLGVPVIQGLTVRASQAEWAASSSGLSPLDAAMKVVMAEFDGRIISTVIGAQELTPAGASRQVAIPAQIEALAALTARWGRLRRLPNREKRLAIVLTNFANRNGRVGSAVGLDTPASVLRILQALREEGYVVGDLPPDGDALMEELLALGGYEVEWLSEEQARQSAHYRVADYTDWFARLPEPAQAALRATWGEPPGQVMTVGDLGYIPARRYGNVVVLIQPPRGYGENRQALYHSGELAPSHHYLAVYHWLRTVFGVDAVIHCGKHGTVEWLPGKSLGLSAQCYPQLVLGDTPVFYPFLVGDPGEGLQAKRRWHAALVSHLPPPMTQAEVEQECELAPLQALLTELGRADQLDPEKRPLIVAAIWEAVVAANLHRDLGYTARPDEDEWPAFLKKLDGYLCELGEIQIRNGLHVFGEAPQGERLVDFLCALARQGTPERPGLPTALAQDLGLPPNLADLPAETAWLPEAVPSGLAACDPSAITSVGRLRRALDAAVRELVATAVAHDFDLTHPFAAKLGSATRTGLAYLGQDILPRVRRAPDEIRHLLDGLAGRAIPPGPSGAPTRGMPDILPTGRNMYAVDVRAVPSPFAWEVGRQLGDALVASYIAQKQAFPEVVGLTLWGTSNMRTQGDDVAQVLWLLGVEPCWQPASRRVIGLRRLPLETLRRPRIDVVLRVSGFFRDAFPNVIALLDEAVRLAAAADEPDEWNYVRKRTRVAEAHYVAAGDSPDAAHRRARFRIFSNQPGVYGVGILAALSEKAWTERADLADIYLRWSGYAYTADEYGTPAGEVFARQLAACDVAVQNQDNREHDILDSDDYMQFHGGMAAAIENLRGQAPTTLFGDTSDPARPRVRTLREELRRVIRARVTNPKWLRAIREHGYKGALEMAATVDYLFGYAALTDLVDDWVYERVAEAYLFDEEMASFLGQSNPWSQRDIADRLLEAVERGLWRHPPETMTTRLRDIQAGAEARIMAAGKRG
ncbi:MAG: cobaltochelatase subunit CobN [Chloracidobacterium sp.]